MINRSMRSDYACSSVPGFRTPSTMDSRQILKSRVSPDYPSNINKKTLSRLRREVHQLIQKKMELMQDIRSIQKSKF